MPVLPCFLRDKMNCFRNAMLSCALIAALFSLGGTADAAPSHAVCASASAAVQPIAEVDNTRDGNFHCLGVSLVGGRIAALRVESHKFNSVYRRVAEEVNVAEFPVAQIESSRGAVLDGEPGHDAIIVQGHFTAAGRAELVTRYLYDGFTGEYRSCSFAIDRAPDSHWQLVNGDNRAVSTILVRTRQVPLFGTVGIATLEGACAMQKS